MECREFIIDGKISAAEHVLEQHTEIIVLSHGLGGDGGTIYKYFEYFNKHNKGVFSFDYPCHGHRKENYKEYTVENCLKTLDKVYKYITGKYPDKKISFLATSLGSLYLYKYIIDNEPKINKVLFKCMPLQNADNMRKAFFKNEKIKKGYFTVYPGLDLPKKLLVELNDLESSLTEIKCIDKKNILFVHGTNDELAEIKNIRTICNNFHYSLKEVDGTNHNFKSNNGKIILTDTIHNFLGE